MNGLVRRRPGPPGEVTCAPGLRVGRSSYRSFSCFSPARSLSAAVKSSARSCARPPPRPARRIAGAISCSLCRTAHFAAIWPLTIRQRNYGKAPSCSARRRDRVDPHALLGVSLGARADLQLAVIGPSFRQAPLRAAFFALNETFRKTGFQFSVDALGCARDSRPLPAETPRGIKMLCTMRLACRIVLPAALLFAIAAAGIGGAAAQQGTPEARQACTPDAMRLCSDFIPDVAKVTHCMLSKRGQLSAACRAAMAGGHRGGYAKSGRAAPRYSRGRCAHFRCR